MSTIDLYPTPTEVAVFSLPAGTVVRVHHPDGVREYPDTLADPDAPDHPFSATIPGDRETLGWGARIVAYWDVRRIATGHRKVDRKVWQETVKAIRRGGVVYVDHEQQDYYGKQVWVATGLREEGER